MNERDIFLAALEQVTAENRSRYLDQTCGNDPMLRQRVEELLRTHERTGEFLQVPLIDRLAERVTASQQAASTSPDGLPADDRRGELGFLTPSDQPGSLGKLGHYEVQEVIGAGGMGTVLRAFDQRLHRVVAIKVMAAPLATSAAARKRFEREARAAAAVCHDQIVTIHAVEEAVLPSPHGRGAEGEGLPYLVMQCVSGMSLQQRIDRDGPLELHEILRIGMQTAAGLAAAHAQGLIHRDIKPANILLENGVERVKITDFGLARAAADASVSQSGIVAGTPQYMAPEQAKGEVVDQRADLFSLGSVLYAMCTGRAPFRATSSLAVLKRVCEEAPSPIREANVDVPDWLIALIDKLQAKDPNDRYQSAAEVAELLGKRLAELQYSAVLPVFAATKAPRSPIPSPQSAIAMRRWAAAAAILLALVLTFGIAEATGVTQVAATVVRLLTPEGTLVVETSDPSVKVTIEGDGGLVITGAGPQEVRLRPGSYQLRADKNGKPVSLDRELVTITRGGKQVVRVRMESAAPAAAAAPMAFGEVRRYAGHRGAVSAVAFSPDGQFALSGNTGMAQPHGPLSTGPEFAVKLWNVASGQCLWSITHEVPVAGVCISGDGRRALTATSAGELSLLEFPSGKEVRRWNPGTGAHAVAVSHDAKYGATGIEHVRLWDLERGQLAHVFPWAAGVPKTPETDHEVVWSIAFSPDASRLAAAGHHYTKRESELAPQSVIHVWDLASRTLMHVLAGHTDHVKSVVFSSDGRRLLSGSFDGTVRLWDAESGALVQTFLQHNGLVEGVALTRDGRRAVSAGWYDKTVRVWDVDTGIQLLAYEHPVELLSVAVSPDGRQVLSGGADGVLRLWKMPLETRQRQKPE
jgi:serine/threonine protein kinase/WD40 repeat protein